jgi:diacylglycerol kinase (ATP)
MPSQTLRRANRVVAAWKLRLLAMKKDSAFSVMRLVQALFYSLKGLRVAFLTEGALRLELCVLIALVPLALLATDKGFERALLIGSWLAVIVVEVINSAIEAIVDRIGREYDELSGRAKDLGSAAVFCAVVTAGVVWLFILI